MDTHQISKTYNAQEWEDKLYAKWEENGLFQPDTCQSQKRYSNILPPPNANGELHIGHISGYTVMDIFGRFERMKGKKTLLLPGKDHAGIQTQVVFEKKTPRRKKSHAPRSRPGKILRRRLRILHRARELYARTGKKDRAFRRLVAREIHA